MALGGCYTCLKYLMFVFNFIFWLVGAALLAIGIWAKVDEKSLTDTIKNVEIASTVAVGAWVVIVVGAIIFILGFLGCCGAIRESQCMLATFFVLLCIIFAVLLAAGIYVIVSMKVYSEAELFDQVRKQLENAEANYTKNDALKLELDNIHKNFDCCGVDKGSFLTHGYSIELVKKSCGDDYPSKEGCLVKVQATVRKLAWILVGIAIGTAVIMLLGMIFSMLLCCAIREVA